MDIHLDGTEQILPERPQGNGIISGIPRMPADRYRLFGKLVAGQPEEFYLLLYVPCRLFPGYLYTGDISGNGQGVVFRSAGRVLSPFIRWFSEEGRTGLLHIAFDFADNRKQNT